MVYLKENTCQDVEYGIYIHLPFCAQKCLYCDFISCSATEKEREIYIRYLRNEIRIASKNPVFSRGTCCSIYFGGGTPSICSEEDIGSILNDLKKNFTLDPDAEITIEVNPESVSSPLLKYYKISGINRISAGFQSAHNAELKTLGRIHDVKMAVKAVELIKNIGIGNFNIDLMFCIPGQDFNSWKYSLKTILELKPPHISFYGLTYEDFTPFKKLLNSGKIFKCPDSLYEKMYLTGVNRLIKEGYIHYEVSNFALSGKESVHNRLYWSLKPYLGIGMAAHSFDGRSRWWNEKTFDLYYKKLDNGDPPVEEIEYISLSKCFTEDIFLSLRTNCGLKLSSFYAKYPENIIAELNNKLKSLSKDSPSLFSECSNDIYILSPKGMLLLDEIVSGLI